MSSQVRQKGGQRKTLFYLEQLLIKYEATRECSAIKPNAEGLDFFFGSESGAREEWNCPSFPQGFWFPSYLYELRSYEYEPAY